jgi:hypothetical protein
MPGMQTDLEIKQFEMLNTLLDELHKRLMSGTSATAGFLLVGIGWFVTAKDAAPFLHEHPHFILIAALAPVLGSLLYAYGTWLVYKRSQNIVGALRRLEGMPAELYENNVISRGQLMIFTGGIILFGVILAGCIYYTGHSSATKDEPDEDETYMQVALPNTPETRLGEHLASDLVVDLGRPSVALPHSVPLGIVD